MAAKTANVLARVEPELKVKAEGIMAQLGIPASVVINMLYKQIVMTKSIPFALSIPRKGKVMDQISEEEFMIMMKNGLANAKEDNSRLVKDVFNDLKLDMEK